METQTRSYIHVKDAVEATMIVKKNKFKGFEIYKVGNEDWMTVNEVAEVCNVHYRLKKYKVHLQAHPAWVG